MKSPTLSKPSALALALLLLAFALPPIPPALAEEPPAVEREDSPAARLYRDAWWTETATGDLEGALVLYGRVEAEEGSAAVKARALFRRGVVLERLGRMEDAVRLFERLAKEHPDEKGLLEEARARLDAWTAEDLEGSFDAWYERYRYSPAFQAKVVDLVLRLGTTPFDRTLEPPAEERELLTIGDAALPALRRHLETSNETLRAWATALLLQLGEVPPVEALLATEIWRHREAAWKTLLTLPEVEAARLQRALPDAETEGGEVLRAAFRGPEAALQLFAAAGPLAERRISGQDWEFSLFQALLDRPGGEPSVASLVSYVRDGATFGSLVLDRLMDRGEAPESLVLHVVRDGDLHARVVALRRILMGAFVHPLAWRAAAEAILANASDLKSSRNTGLGEALVVALAAAEPDADLEPAVRAFARWQSVAGRSARPGPGTSRERFAEGLERLLSVALEHPEVPMVAEETLTGLSLLAAGGGPGQEAIAPSDTTGRLLELARTAPWAGARFAAAHGIRRLLQGGAAPVDPAVEALRGLEPDAASAILWGLSSQSERIEWTPERLDRFLRAAQDLADTPARPWVVKVLEPLAATRGGFETLLARVAEAPEDTWPLVLRYVTVPDEVARDPTFQARVRAVFRTRWDAWSDAARVQMTEALAGLLDRFEPDPALQAWIRDSARGEADVEARRALLGLLETLTLEDLRAVHDLEDPEQAVMASRWAEAPKTLEVYEALAAARAHPDGAVRDRFYGRWLDSKRVEDGVRRAAARDMLEDPQGHTRAAGVARLAEFQNPTDLPLLVRALEDPVPVVRRAAAAALQGLYDTAALAALAAALDDPDPEVRSQVLETLEAIKKEEDLKAYWRKFAEEQR